MSGYVLTYRNTSMPALVDGSLLRPDTLGVLDRAAIGAVLLPLGRTRVPLTKCFDIEGSEGSMLVIRKAPLLDRLGANMASGTLIIEGDAGDDLGASMTGGLIRVHGNAGHRVGGPAVTSKRGMTGGEILIDANAGDYAGFLMRRGLIAIAGHTGKSPGYRMLAGTIVLGSPCDSHPGLEMQRGSIIGCDQMKVAASFSASGTIAASAMPAMLMVLRRLRSLQWKCESGPLATSCDAASGAWRLWSGDGLTLNKGEVLAWLS